MDSSFWEGVLFCALLATAFMYAVQSAAQKYLEEEKVALTYLFEPIFAAFAGAMLLGETTDGRTLAGAALIFSALLIAEIDVPKFLSACCAPCLPRGLGANEYLDGILWRLLVGSCRRQHLADCRR